MYAYPAPYLDTPPSHKRRGLTLPNTKQHSPAPTSSVHRLYRCIADWAVL